MGHYLETAPNIESAVVRNITVQGVTPRSPKSLEGRNLVNNCPNGASEEFIGIYAKSKCQWSSHLIKIKLAQGKYGHLNLHGP